MKKFLCMIFVFITVYGIAKDQEIRKDYLDYWTKAVLSCTSQNFDQGILEFTQALDLLEEGEDKSHDHIYVDRGRAYLLVDKLEEALSDFDYALIRNNLSQKDLTRALISKIVTLSRLNRNEECLALFDELKKNDQEFPKTTITKDYIIIRNMPDCNCYRTRIKSYLIHSGICENDEAIQMLSSGICIAKKKCNCGCKDLLEQNINDVEKRSEESLDFVKNSRLNEDGKCEECKRWCDKMAVAGATWCGRFRTYKCQAACVVAVDFLKEGCYWCCEGEGFYKRCIKPFEDISDYIQAPFDPMWD